jgi:hypothetical protein
MRALKLEMAAACLQQFIAQPTRNQFQIGTVTEAAEHA